MDTLFPDGGRHRLLIGDAVSMLAQLPETCVHVCCTSPPYYSLRDYGHAGQIGLEKTPEEYVARLVEVFAGVRRVLRDDGTLWLNLGDTYNAFNGNRGRSRSLSAATQDAAMPALPSGYGLTAKSLKPKDLLGIPWRVAFALQADGWYLRSAVPWIKRNPMPESAADRPGVSHEYVFLLSQSPDYYYDGEAVKIPAAPDRQRGTSRKHLHNPAHTPERCHNGLVRGSDAADTRNRRSGDWWFDSLAAILAGASGMLTDDDGEPAGFAVNLRPYKGAHFAVWPPELVTPMILASTPETGCCATCGAPRRRHVQRDRVPTRPGRDTKVTVKSEDANADTCDALGWNRANAIGNRDPQRHVTRTITLGWEKDCTCPTDDTRPAVVLDPFAGSGTTVAAALAVGRRGIGCELNPDYAALAEERIRSVNPSFF